MSSTKDICASTATWEFLQDILRHPRVKKITMPEVCCVDGNRRGDRFSILVETYDANGEKVAITIKKVGNG